MNRRRHPLSGAVYDVVADGVVEVTLDGTRGLFDARGCWIEGDLTHADPHLCLWLAGPQVSRSDRDAGRAR